MAKDKDAAGLSKDLEQLVEKGEGQRFEAKATLLLDFKRLVMGDGNRLQNKKLLLEGLLKTMTAFLNTEGGTIAIGLVEVAKFDKIINPIYKDLPRLGDFIIIGIEVEYPDKAKNLKDHYENVIRSFVKTHIAEVPHGKYHIDFVNVNNRTVCLVNVDKHAKGTWYYLDHEHFYIREGNETNQLKGPAMDNYKLHHE